MAKAFINRAMNNSPPRFLNLLAIRLPLPGVASFLHRISGLLLILSIPFALYGLDLSLRDASGYTSVIEWFSGGLGMTVLGVMGWALSHHFFAGIRFLLIDIEVGVERSASRASAVWVISAGIVAGIIIVLLAGGNS